MRILLDACVPRGLRGSFPRHQVSTAHDLGWGDFDNGELLDAMGDRFDVLVTVDRGLPKQQHIVGRPFGIMLLRARSNRLVDLQTLASKFEAAPECVRPRAVSSGRLLSLASGRISDRVRLWSSGDDRVRLRRATEHRLRAIARPRPQR